MVIAKPTFEGYFRISFGNTVITFSAVGFTELPHDTFCIGIIFQDPRRCYRVPVICRNQSNRIGSFDFGILYCSIDISIGTNLSCEDLFHAVGGGFFQKERAPVGRISDLVEKAFEMNIACGKFVINLLHALINVIEGIDLILK